MNILIVDDNSVNLKLLSEIVKEAGYKPRPVPNGTLAVQAIETQIPNLILLDINMPDINGYQICDALQKNSKTKEIPIIFVSALTGSRDKITGMALGAVDYINKPIDAKEVVEKINLHIKKTDELGQVQTSSWEMIKSFCSLCFYREDNSLNHAIKIEKYSQILLEELKNHKSEINVQFVEDFKNACSLYDIGKSFLPDALLLKKSLLTVEEKEKINAHTTLGAEFLRSQLDEKDKEASLYKMAMDIIEFHHEKYDGTGYPQKIEGEDIPLSARVMGLIMTYHALRSDRIYREGTSHLNAYQAIAMARGSAFDPEVVDAFVKINAKFNEVFEGKI